MNRQPMNLQRQLMKRKGLTLIEMLIAITVLGILGGMLMAGLFPMLNRARETAIVTELKQIESAIEQFQIEYGFYPPSFKSIRAQGTPAQQAQAFARYVSKIAPNHNENVANWWNTVGSTIQEQNGEDLVFWLSGLFKNKQYPLTNDGTANKTAYDNGVANRKVFFEFASDRVRTSGSFAASFNQDSSVPSPYVYIDSSSYAVNAALPPGACKSPADQFYNLKTFQISAPGLDKERSPGGGRINEAPLVDHDNICNFAGGRLDTFLNSLE